MTGPGAVLDRSPTKPDLDPRLRARRIEVRRREGRRRLRRLVALLVLTIVCAGAWGISRSPLLDVDHVEVSGTRRADPEQIVAVSGIGLGDPLIDLDLAGAEAAIAELGWVARVEATRSWKGTVTLAVIERQPIAVASASDGGLWLIDSEGRVLDSATATDVSTLPRIEGLDIPGPSLTVPTAQMLAVKAANGLSSGLRSWVGLIVLEPGGELWFDLVAPATSGITLSDARARLGDGRDLTAQLAAVETILVRVDLECLAVIDARVGSAPVVTRHEGCGAEA